ncbi:MAG: HD domain-containing protein [Thermoguttaceae bacterium]|jgi:orotate phosphoribosyltransferase
MTRFDDNLAVVQAMKTYLPRYQQIRESIASQLQPTAYVHGDTFTSHGADHCARILRHLNILLEGWEPFFNDIKAEELFCLGVAVMLHDIVMTVQPQLRRTHSGDAKRIIREEFERTRGSFAAIQIDAPVVDAVADIVYAHSDLKDEAGNITERTLEAVRNAERSGEGGSRLRTYVPAALLRFGDELDCTLQRIQDSQALIAAEHKDNPHWRKCALIREIMPPSGLRTDIEVNVNDLALQSSDDKANDMKLILEVREKLQKSLEEVNTVVFHRVGWWHFNTVKLTAESQRLMTSLEPHDPLGTPIQTVPEASPAHEVPTRAGAVAAAATQEAVGLISADPEMASKLNEWVVTKRMLKSGHFSMSPGRHATDWIDTSQLLEETRYLGQIVNSFIGILTQRGVTGNDAVLIGAGFPGLIIASQMSFVGGYGCSYIVPVHDGGREEKYSRLPEIPESKSIVLVTDVVAEGKTLGRVMQCLSDTYGVSPDRVRAILTVFVRRPTRIQVPMENSIKDKLVPLNCDFPIQICDKAVGECMLYRNKLVEVINEDLSE